MTQCTVANGYPANWKRVSVEIRARSGGRCECTGECGLHQFTPPGPRRCTERDGQPARWAKGKVMLTTAHLDAPGGPCSCEQQQGKKCADPAHLKAMCNRCHLRMDVPRHVESARNTRAAKRLARQPRLIP